MSEKLAFSLMLTRPATHLATVARPCTAQNAALLPAHLARYAHSESLVFGDRHLLPHPLYFVSQCDQGLPAYRGCSAYIGQLALRLYQHPQRRRTPSRHLPDDQRIILTILPAEATFAPVYSHDQRRIFLRPQGGEAQRREDRLCRTFRPVFPSFALRRDLKLGS